MNVFENVTFVVFILFHYFGKNTIQSRWLIPINFLHCNSRRVFENKVFWNIPQHIFQGLKTYFNAKLNLTRYVSSYRCLLKFVLEASGSCYNKKSSCVYQIVVITIIDFVAVAQFSLFMRSIKCAKYHFFILLRIYFISFFYNAKVNIFYNILCNLIILTLEKCYTIISIYSTHIHIKIEFSKSNKSIYQYIKQMMQTICGVNFHNMLLEKYLYSI